MQRVSVESLERRTLFAAPLLFVDTFEDGDVAGWMRSVSGTGTVDVVGPGVVAARAGAHAVRFTLPAGETRTEINRWPPEPAGAERWYGFSVLVPTNYATDPNADTIAQWHDVPDTARGENFRSPALKLGMLNGRFEVVSRWDSRTVNNDSFTPPAPTGGRTDYDLGAVPKGVWNDFVFHVKWSHQSTGLLEVWRNGNKVVSRAGPNSYNDWTGGYFKIGNYHHIIPAPVTKVLYHDEVRIGDGGNVYADVAPSQTGLPPASAPITINGTAGPDTIVVTQAGTTLKVVRNGVGSIQSTAGKAALVINGLAGNDTILLAASVALDAKLNGGAGNDRLRGGGGRDVFNGGDGIDFADFADSDAPVYVSLDNATNDGPGRRDNVRSDVENAIGGRAGDTFAGNASANVFVGNGGDDTLRGGSGRDVLIGGAGKDRLYGEAYDDLLIAPSTAYDQSTVALATLQSGWTDPTRGYSARVSRLRTGFGGIRVSPASILPDRDADTLSGADGIDWFISDVLDALTDRTSNERQGSA